MAYGNGNNDTEYEAGAPKKADVLIRSTQHIALKQEELTEQTKHVAEKLDEAIDLFSKSSQDSSYMVKQNSEIFNQLQSENSALKQELLYLAKQSENIYAGLAEKITELSDQAKTRENALTSLADRVNDVSEQTLKSGETYSNIIDKITELAEQNKRNEKLFTELNEKLDALSERTRKSEKAYGELSDKIVVSDRSEPSDAGSGLLIDKINYISEQLRRSEGAHSMLADKFEILSMRVEQFGFESAKGAPSYNRPAAPAAYPVPTEVKAEVDYDKLAEKVAELISAREVVSPDYIASKVAEQVVIPEIQSANVKVSVDTHDIAKEVAELIDLKVVKTDGTPSQTVTNINLDEEALADRIAEKIGMVNSEAVTAVADVDEDELAERIARKVGGMNRNVSAPITSVSANIDEDELADSIALKVGSLKAEDFEILVDDEGCASISKEIAQKLDYNTISNIIADKLRDALDLASVNAPDYEEMAERISEKITVAGINEAAIADKAAAALSNYLPEIDTDEIADKVTGAVIDVVSAIPQPTVDSEAICNAISEKLIQSQEDHDYDIVMDDEGISKITELVTEEIEKGTGERFDRVEEEIAKLCELLTKEEETEVVEEVVEDGEPKAVVTEEDYTKLTSLVAAEIEKGTASRFDKVEDDVAKLTELLSNIVVEEDYAEEDAEAEEVAEDYSALSEVVAAEIEKGIEGVATRISDIEENVAKITEYLAAEEEVEEEIGEEEEYAEEDEEVVEEDYTALSEIVAAEIEKGVASRLCGMEENIAKITEYLTAEEEAEDEEYGEEEYAEEDEEVVEEDYAEEDEEVVEEDYTALSEIVAAEIEKGVASRLSGIEENVARISEYLASAETEEETNAEVEVEQQTVVVEDYSAISEIVAAEIEKGVASRLSGIEENVAKISEVEESIVKLSEYITAEKAEEPAEANEAEAEEYVEIDDYSAISEIVAAEIEKGVASRLSGIEENVAKISEVEESIVKLSEYITAEKTEEPAEANEAEDDKEYVEIDDCTVLSEVLAAEIEKGVASRLSDIEENVAKISEYLAAAETAEETGTEEVRSEETAEQQTAVIQDYTALSEVVAAEIEKGVASRLSGMEENINKVGENITKVEESLANVSEHINSEQVRTAKAVVSRIAALEEHITSEQVRTAKGVVLRIATAEDNINKALEENIAKVPSAVGKKTDEGYEEVDDLATLSEVVATEIDRGISFRLDSVEENLVRLTELIEGAEVETQTETVAEIPETDYDKISELVAAEIEKGVASRLSSVEENIVKVDENVSKLAEIVESSAEVKTDDRIEKVQDDVAQIKEMLSNGVIAASETAAAQAAAPVVEEAVEEDEEELVTVSGVVEPEEEELAVNQTPEPVTVKQAPEPVIIERASEPVKEKETIREVKEYVKEKETLIILGNNQPATETVSQPAKQPIDIDVNEYEEFEEDEEEEDDDDKDDFSIDVLDMDAFSDDELMPGELSDYADGVDFANMMKFKRSFIARIIQSNDEYKQYYGEVKHALLSYKKVNSNVAWGAERFNKGRETIARMKIRGKTLCLYLALDPNNYKTSVYHHLDVSDNKSVAGTPMMVKIKSNLGVRKAIRLIDEMLAMRNGERKEIPERDYAAMYPYETIEELIDEGLVKDVRKK